MLKQIQGVSKEYDVLQAGLSRKDGRKARSKDGGRQAPDAYTTTLPSSLLALPTSSSPHHSIFSHNLTRSSANMIDPVQAFAMATGTIHDAAKSSVSPRTCSIRIP